MAIPPNLGVLLVCQRFFLGWSPIPNFLDSSIIKKQSDTESTKGIIKFINLIFDTQSPDQLFVPIL